MESGGGFGIERQEIIYELTRCKRKTLAVRITEQGSVQVRAPWKLPEKYIRQFLDKHRDFILQTVQERQMLWQKKQSFSVTQGDTLLVFGREYPVRFAEKACFTGDDFEIPHGDFETVKGEIVREYRRLAKDWIGKRVQEISREIGVEALSVKVNSAKTRWGSCSGKNALNFSWRLIFADQDSIDYIIIHELCHIRHHNHSKAFWQMVGGIVPDYKIFQQRLNQLGQRLQWENWEESAHKQ